MTNVEEALEDKEAAADAMQKRVLEAEAECARALEQVNTLTHHLRCVSLFSSCSRSVSLSLSVSRFFLSLSLFFSLSLSLSFSLSLSLQCVRCVYTEVEGWQAVCSSVCVPRLCLQVCVCQRSQVHQHVVGLVRLSYLVYLSV